MADSRLNVCQATQMSGACRQSASRPGGTLHLVGAAEQSEATLLPMIVGQKSISASPTGSIVRAKDTLESCARHDIRPPTEQYPMSQINDAMARLEAGAARYRVALKGGE